MNPEPNPIDSTYPLHPSPSPEKKGEFSTPPSNLHQCKDAKWLNQRIAKKEFKTLYAKSLQTVSKKLTFDENMRGFNAGNEETVKILKLR